jgi:hypothetical protein
VNNVMHTRVGEWLSLGAVISVVAKRNIPTAFCRNQTGNPFH